MDDGGLRSGRTDPEIRFLGHLTAGRPWLDVWLHNDGNGTPWACVSVDMGIPGVVQDTLRLDFDGTSIQGGWSPAFLNWDDGVRAVDVGIDLTTPDGIDMSGDASDLAEAAADWLDRHRSEWPGSERAARWR